MKALWETSRLDFRFEDKAYTEDFFSLRNVKSEFDESSFVVLDHWSTFQPYLRKNPLYASIMSDFFGENPMKVSHLRVND